MVKPSLVENRSISPNRNRLGLLAWHLNAAVFNIPVFRHAILFHLWNDYSCDDNVDMVFAEIELRCSVRLKFLDMGM